MLSISFVTYRVPELRHVASLHLSVDPEHCWCHRGSCVFHAQNHLCQPLHSHAHSCFGNSATLHSRLRVEWALRSCRPRPSCQGTRPGARTIHAGCHSRMPQSLHIAIRCVGHRLGPQLCHDIFSAYRPYLRATSQDDQPIDKRPERGCCSRWCACTLALRLWRW